MINKYVTIHVTTYYCSSSRKMTVKLTSRNLYYCDYSNPSLASHKRTFATCLLEHPTEKRSLWSFSSVLFRNIFWWALHVKLTWLDLCWVMLFVSILFCSAHPVCFTEYVQVPLTAMCNSVWTESRPIVFCFCVCVDLRFDSHDRRCTLNMNMLVFNFRRLHENCIKWFKYKCFFFTFLLHALQLKYKQLIFMIYSVLYSETHTQLWKSLLIILFFVSPLMLTFVCLSTIRLIFHSIVRLTYIVFLLTQPLHIVHILMCSVSSA